MYAYTRELTAGSLVLSPKLAMLLQTLANWEPTWDPGTIAPGRRMGKCFARLAQIDVLALRKNARIGQPMHLIGDQQAAAIYASITKLTKSGLWLVDTFPSLLHLEYERSSQQAGDRLTEGYALHHFEIIVPFLLLEEAQVNTLFLMLKQRLPTLTNQPQTAYFTTSTLRIHIHRQDHSMPQRTIIVVDSPSETLIWRTAEKIYLHHTSNFIVSLLEKM